MVEHGSRARVGSDPGHGVRALDPLPGIRSADAPRVLQRLCRALTLDLDLAGAAVTLLPDVDSHTVAAASSVATRRIEELQFDLGEGPTRDAARTVLPVLATDLVAHVRRWPGFAPAALAARVAAVVSAPLHSGTSSLGALTLYWHRAGRPGPTALRTALVHADLATRTLVDGADGVRAELGTDERVYQAQGMVMVDLEVGPREALARMRAQAYAAGQSLVALAADILDEHTLVEKDSRDDHSEWT